MSDEDDEDDGRNRPWDANEIDSLLGALEREPGDEQFAADAITVIKQLRSGEQALLAALADISSSDDMTLELARSKAKRLYDAYPPAPAEPAAVVVSRTGDPDVTMSWWIRPALPVGSKLYGESYHAPAAQWRPIATAPKDGTEFIGFGTLHGDYGYTEDEKTWTGCSWSGNGFVCTKPEGRHDTGWTFTHWHPLPSAPLTSFGDRTQDGNNAR